MAIKRYIATKDCSITNVYKDGLVASASISNDGAADSLQVFSIYNQTGFETSSANNRKSRILVDFPITTISSDISSGYISRDSEFYIKLSNVRHSETVPRDFYLVVTPLSESFEEGYGLDQLNFSDTGAANWLSRSVGTTWSEEGGVYLSQSAQYNVPVYFKTGVEDLKVDITTIVRDMLSGNIDSYGFGILLSSSHETSVNTFYNKKFSGRTSEFFYQRPWIEARWDDSLQDDRLNSYCSSSLAPAEDNLNTVYLYNYIRGSLKNIPSVGLGAVYVDFYSGSIATGTALYNMTGGYVSTGLYSATFHTTYTGTVYDFWYDANRVLLYSSSIKMKNFNTNYYDAFTEFNINVPNLKTEYSTTEKAKIRVNVTKKYWDSNYSLVYSSIPNIVVLDRLYYKVDRIFDNFNVIEYGSGSTEFTKTSFDLSGNYFNINMNLFEPNHSYQIKFMKIIDDQKHEFKESFKFRVISTEEDIE